MVPRWADATAIDPQPSSYAPRPSQSPPPPHVAGLDTCFRLRNPSIPSGQNDVVMTKVNRTLSPAISIHEGYPLVGFQQAATRTPDMNAGGLIAYFLNAAWVSSACSQGMHMAAAGTASSLDCGMAILHCSHRP
jgi:hypothetical protein